MTLLFAKASLLSRKSVTWEPLAAGMKFLYVIEGRISCPQHALVTSLLVSFSSLQTIIAMLCIITTVVCYWNVAQIVFWQGNEQVEVNVINCF